DSRTISIPALDPAPVAPAALASSTGDTSSATAEVRSSGRSPAGWVALGFGVVGLGVGSYLGLRAMTLQGSADPDWADGCSANAVRATNDAIKAANLSTVGFGVGIVGVGLGTFLLLSSGGSPTRRSSGGEPKAVPTLSTGGGPKAAPTLSIGLTASASVSPAGSQVTIAGGW